MTSSRLEIGLKEFQDKDFLVTYEVAASHVFARTEAEKAYVGEVTPKLLSKMSTDYEVASFLSGLAL